ncbi:sensor histidine kinase [Trichococcus shcherbakoviae]|uniref:histidine kinase n=1 Tax=Trichococcus shcherbakoviae subsp. psychrophilus TaxID=2585775 RepID=A0A5C5E7K1_9LACT|nr:ATP-binding protein [Trichococcus shcherbakoviae]TNV69159.1 cell wall metabolism sensor histidine kinase WalK [Trichococcus shcherbakoviae subsp. psychrophilus]
MKRTSIFLKSWVLVTFLTVTIMTLMYIGHAIISVNSIEDTYTKLLQEKITAYKDTVMTNPEVYLTQAETAQSLDPELSYFIKIGDQSRFVVQNPDLQGQSEPLLENILANDEILDAIDSNVDDFSRITIEDEENNPLLLMVFVHTFELQGQAGMLVINYELDEFQAYELNAKSITLLLLTVYLMGTIVYYQYLIRNVAEPLEVMTDIAFKYSRNDFSKRITFESYDEISGLGTAMNKLGKTLQATTLMNREERELLNHLFDSLPAGILYFDQNFHLKLVNGPGQEFLDFWRRVDPDAEAKAIPHQFKEMVQHAFTTTAGSEADLSWSQRHYNVKVTPVIQTDLQKTAGVLIVLQDVTNERQLDIIRGDFITNVSHDLRTPLQMIKGYSEAIIDNIAESNAEKIEMAQIILDETTEMNKMVNNLLDLSRMQAGYIELNRQTVDLATFFNHLAGRFENSFKEAAIQFSYELDDGIKTYPFDEEKMNQVFYNLIDNAVRYSAEIGTRRQKFIHITVRLEDMLDKVVFEISDNGIGIQAESLPFIFERFYKNDKSRTYSKQKGTGIGLSIVKTIVEAHDGEIEVHSEPGVGTTFLARFPFHAS